jgi:hypothetical protein
MIPPIQFNADWDQGDCQCKETVCEAAVEVHGGRHSALTAARNAWHVLQHSIPSSSGPLNAYVFAMFSPCFSITNPSSYGPSDLVSHFQHVSTDLQLLHLIECILQAGQQLLPYHWICETRSCNHDRLDGGGGVPSGFDERERGDEKLVDVPGYRSTSVGGRDEGTRDGLRRYISRVWRRSEATWFRRSASPVFS